jgi:DNA polymerase-3 subunit epsilon
VTPASSDASPPDAIPVTSPGLTLARPLAVLDVEATGVDVSIDRVVEVAVVRVGPGGGRTVFHSRVNPGIPIPPAAASVHGITDDDVAGCPPFAAVAPDLLQFLAGADPAGFGICRFDLPLLAAEFNRAGLDFPLAGRAVVDALAVFHRHERRDLAAAVRLYLGREHARAHSALADAEAALAVLDAQVARYALPPTPADLHAALIDGDVAGRLRKGPDGRVVLGFGKHARRPLADVAHTDPSYLTWVLANVPLLHDALALPRLTADGSPLPHRDLLVLVAFAVVLFTLVVQGQTLPALIRRLGVSAGADEQARAEAGAWREVLSAAVAYLDAATARGDAGDGAAHLRERYERWLVSPDRKSCR